MEEHQQPAERRGASNLVTNNTEQNISPSRRRRRRHHHHDHQAGRQRILVAVVVQRKRTRRDRIEKERTIKKPTQYEYQYNNSINGDDHGLITAAAEPVQSSHSTRGASDCLGLEWSGRNAGAAADEELWALQIYLAIVLYRSCSIIPGNG